MAEIQLVRQRTREVQLKNNIVKTGKLELKSSFNVQVRYAPDGKSCVAAVFQQFKSEEEGQELSVSVTLEGFFNCKDVTTAEDKKKVHVMAYDALFPYLQAEVGQLFAGTGMPGFMLKKMEMDPDRVNYTEAKPKAPTLPIV